MSFSETVCEGQLIRGGKERGVGGEGREEEVERSLGAQHWVI